jgi:Glycosyltransferase family 87
MPAGVRHEWLFDPHGVFRDISRCPYAPPLLAVYALLCWLPYTTQRLLWFALEWTCLLVSIAWLARTIRPPTARAWFVVLALTFFAGGSFWRLHVERGQYYALVLLLMAWAARGLVRRGGDDWAPGVALGIAAALRPTAIVVAAPLWLLGYRRTAAATLATAAGIVLLLLPATGIVFWKDYVRLVGTLERAVPGLPPLVSLPYSTWVEGADFTRVLDDRSSNANIHLLLVTLQGRLGWPPLALVPALAKAGFFIATALMLGLVFRGRAARWRPRTALALAFTTAMVADHFVPVRWGYTDTLYLAPLGLLMPVLLRKRGRVLLFVVLAALGLGHSLLQPLDGPPGSILRAVLLTGGLVGWTVAVTRRGIPARRAA